MSDTILAALAIPYHSTAEGYEYLLLQHVNGTWTFPGGGMDPEDITLENCLVREIKEEIGLDISKEDLNDTGLVNRFTYDNKKPERAGKTGETHFYLLRLNGDENFSSLDKMQNHGWFNAERILELIPYEVEQEMFKSAIKLLD
jgi:8-oxo-dGTP pyrophosphatase MutT (NUDIX family)